MGMLPTMPAIVIIARGGVINERSERIVGARLDDAKATPSSPVFISVSSMAPGELCEGVVTLTDLGRFAATF